MAEIIFGEMLEGEDFNKAEGVLFCSDGSLYGIKRTNNLIVYIKTTSTVKITETAIRETVIDVITIGSMFSLLR